MDLVQDNPELQDQIADLVGLFRKNPKDTRLNNHALTKKMLGKSAFSITDDIRVVFRWANQTTAHFLSIGPHSKVYPKKQSPKR